MNKYLALAVILSIFARITGAPVTSECQDLSEDDEKKMLAEENVTTNFTEVFLPEILTGNSVISLADLLNKPTGSKHCPAANDMSSSAPVNERSSCPWYIDIDTDSKRHPKEIPVAIPRCGPSESCVGMSEAQKDNFECGRIYISIKVLRKEICSATHSKWVEGTERVSVGTTCMKTKEKENSQTASDGGPPSI
ncbi:uncharacterized protein LOC117333422 [Pecten maximus]|uniref:uncharacterized protein LOC117333422 n=1 Tax=Pecten maximus TaxID=6579 RepID=UPI001458BEDA|nr:uncharacterized protein LOC117333422 [Pecten maximus]